MRVETPSRKTAPEIALDDEPYVVKLGTGDRIITEIAYPGRFGDRGPGVGPREGPAGRRDRY